MEHDSGVLNGLSTLPLTAGNWSDLVRLFGERGACGGCWCMWWILPRRQYEEQKGEMNKQALRALLEAGEMPGLLGYLDGEPVAWCAMQPRQAYPGLERSRTLARVDEQPVWSVVCLFVVKKFRRKGFSVRMLLAAVEHAREHRASVVEGYPVEPKSDRLPDAFAWTGTANAYREAGFVEVARRSGTRPIMRYFIEVLD